MTDERQGLPSSSLVPVINLCPGALRMSQVYSQKVSTPESRAWALTGDRVHLYCEAPGLIDLSQWPDELDIAQKCLAERDALKNQLFGSRPRGLQEHIETRFWMKWPNGLKRFSGRVDYAAALFSTQCSLAMVVDYKSLRGDHDESSSNLQVRSQCVLLWLHYERRLEEIFAKVIQPMKGTAALPPVKYTGTDMEAALDQLADILARAEDPKAPLIPGKKQCQFCPARLKCPAAVEVLEDIAEVDRAKISGLEPAELARLLGLCETAEAVIKAAKARGKALLYEDSSAVPGWCLVPNPSVREITDSNSVFDVLVEKGLIDTDDFLRCTKVVIGELEDTIYRRLKKVDKKRTVDSVKKLVGDHLKPFVQMKPKEPSLKRSKEEQ